MKRAIRRFKTENISKKRIKMRKRILSWADNNMELNYFNKNSHISCGNSKCKLCHPHKYYKNVNKNHRIKIKSKIKHLHDIDELNEILNQNNAFAIGEAADDTPIIFTEVYSDTVESKEVTEKVEIKNEEVTCYVGNLKSECSELENYETLKAEAEGKE